ncbi:MAG: cadherin-like beta sandwich domain-containing protein [Nitrospira sp.]|nr:cadherin-like beta sandwich domain-containing protein [Nitrospira sp.]
MRRNHIYPGQRFVAVLISAIGVGAYGCKDSASISDEVQAPLSSLAVTPGALQPAFSGNITEYTVDAPTSATTVTVTATPKDSTTAMTINGAPSSAGQGRSVPLGAPGTTTIVSIVLESQTGQESTYAVAVTRLQSSNNNLSALTVEPGTLDPAFAPGTLTYTANVATSVAEVIVSATKSDPNAVLSGSIADPGVGQATGQATIPLGGPGTSTPVIITVTAPNGNSKTYSITVNRAAPSSDNNLSALTVTGGSLVPGFAASTTAYQVGVPANVASVTVSATKSDSDAVMSGDVTAGTGVATGQATFLLVPLIPRPVSIIITAPNGASKSYTITIIRALL